MKKVLIASTLLACLTVSASAADIAKADGSWSGLYLGAQIGSNKNVSAMSCDSNACAEFTNDTSLTNWIAGGYVGLNHQMDNLVFGIEADANTADGIANFAETDWNATNSGYEITQDYFATVRGRLGGLVSDNLLIYGTAGWAFTNYEMDNPGCSDCSVDNTTRFIWGSRNAPVYGAGLEYAISSSINVKGEYLYADFGDDLVDTGDLENTNDLQTHSVRVGLSIALN